MRAHKKMGPIASVDAKRFWSYVTVANDKDKCWVYNGYIDPRNGYGYFGYNDIRYRAHRVSYFLSTGEDPFQFVICHSCDNPQCCNPSHLFKGTQADNLRDMHQKGRMGNGTKKIWVKNVRVCADSRFCKLTAEQVLSIRAEYAEGGMNQSQLASKYNVSRWAINSLINKRSWKTV